MGARGTLCGRDWEVVGTGWKVSTAELSRGTRDESRLRARPIHVYSDDTLYDFGHKPLLPKGLDAVFWGTRLHKRKRESRALAPALSSQNVKAKYLESKVISDLLLLVLLV